jgi:tetratricopeptide (TPR) repeat protein
MKKGFPSECSTRNCTNSAGGYLRRDDAGGWHIDDRVPFSSLALPRSLRELVARRLDGLPPAARRLVESAAVLGRAFDGDLPNQVAGLSDEEVIEALDQVVARTIFELDEGERLRFQHDKLREIAYAMIDPARLPELHRKVARALEARHQDDLPRFYPALAHHFQMGGEIERALEFLDKSGEAALRSAAYGDAAEAFSRALKLGERAHDYRRRDPPSAQGRLDARRRARWQHGMGKALFGLGDLAGAEEHARAALEQLGHALPRTRLEWARRFAGEAGRQAAQRLGLRKAAPLPSLREDLDEAAQAASLLAHRFYYLGDSIAMITSSLLAVNLAERAGLGWQVPHAYSWLGYVAGLLRLHQLARDYFARARDGAERRHEPSELAFALTVEASCHLGCGRFVEAERCAEEALHLCDAGSDPQTLELTLSTLGHVEFHTGRVREALAQYQSLLASARGRDHQQHVVWALYLSARSLLQMGQTAEAARLLEEARGALGGLGDQAELDSEISAYGLLSLARLRLGDSEGGRRAALETLTRVERSPLVGFSTVDGYDAACETLLVLGERASARRMAAALRRLARLLPMAVPAAWLRWGELECLEGQRRRGHRWLVRSLEQAQVLGMPLDEARARAALASRFP